MTKMRYLYGNKARITIIILCLNFLAGFAFADGIIIPRPFPDVQQIPPLSIRYHHVNISIDNQYAKTEIDQVFGNEFSRDLEGTYIFPLPEDASISEFSMFADNEKLDGKILEKDKAREIYEGIVRQLRDPALLEYTGRNTFTARVYPIPANGEKRIQLAYSEIIKCDNGICKYTYPLETEKFSSKPLKDVIISVKLSSKQAIKAIYSPTHKISIKRIGDYEAEVSYEENNVKPDKDFVLYWTVSEDDFGVNLLTYREKDKEGFFILLLSPRQEIAKEKILPKDIVFVLDTSGSMSGKKIEQAKNALKFIVNNLNENDRFNIITFNTDIKKFKDELIHVNRFSEGWNNMLGFIDSIDASGGTNIKDALLDSLKLFNENNPNSAKIIVFLTDGLPTVGVTETGRILDDVEGANKNKAKIFTFGVGYDVNTHLLDKISVQNSGASEYVEPDEDIEIKVSGFYSKINSPILSDVKLDFNGLRVYDIYPREIPDLFKGSQLILFGRYSGGGNKNGVSIGTDKREYGHGEIVKITLANDLGKENCYPKYEGSGCWKVPFGIEYFIQNEWQNVPVGKIDLANPPHPVYCLQYMALPSTECSKSPVTFYWNQQELNKGNVSSGKYRVKFEVGVGNEFIYSNEFIIKEKSTEISTPEYVLSHSDELINKTISVKGYANSDQWKVDCTKMACSPENPCCNTCSSPLVLKANDKSIVISGRYNSKPVFCSGNDCGINNCFPLEIERPYIVTGKWSGSSMDIISYEEIKPGASLSPLCIKKVKGFGPCEAMASGYEFDLVAKKCVRKNAGGCSFEIPFNTLEECQKTCESKEEITVKLTGKFLNKEKIYSYNLEFPEKNLKNEFIPKLWASRKIGYLLDEIRLNGENKEIVDEIINLSLEYGIMTPYTSFLVDMDKDISRPAVRDEARDMFNSIASKSFSQTSGAGAVKTAQSMQEMQRSGISQDGSEKVKSIGVKTFYNKEGIWIDNEYAESGQVTELNYGSDDYFRLLNENPEFGKYLSIGKNVKFCSEERCFSINEREGMEISTSTTIFSSPEAGDNGALVQAIAIVGLIILISFGVLLWGRRIR